MESESTPLCICTFLKSIYIGLHTGATAIDNLKLAMWVSVFMYLDNNLIIIFSQFSSPLYRIIIIVINKINLFPFF